MANTPGPDELYAPERKLPSTSKKLKLEEDLNAEYMHKLDVRLKMIRRENKRRPYPFILKYIGAWYIVLSIFKGLFYTFSPSFDILGLILFLAGFGLERYNTIRAEREFKEQVHDNPKILDADNKKV